MNTSGFGNRYVGNAEEENYVSIGDTVRLFDSLHPNELTASQRCSDIESVGDLMHSLQNNRGETIDIEIIRDGRSLSLDVELPQPEERRDKFRRGPRA